MDPTSQDLLDLYFGDGATSTGGFHEGINMAPDTPVPAHPTLEDEYLPNSEKIADAVRNLAAY